MRTLREGADKVAAVLREAGYESYFAGGCVRDALLGVEPKDYDIVTDATPAQVCDLFRRTLAIGAAFGVVKVLLGKGLEYEVATYREDGLYSDGRRPDDVVYSSSKVEDVKRRDFTINGLLMDPTNDEILDYVGGRVDLAARLIRAVGEADQRFAEDRLRMLRAIRFAVRFDFEIEPATLAAIDGHAGGIRDVSAERIVAELLGIFRSPRPDRGITLLEQTGLRAVLLSHVEAPDVLEARFKRLPAVRGSVPDADLDHLAWALIIDDLEPRAAESVLRELKLSKDAIRGALRMRSVRSRLHAADAATPSYLRLVLAEDRAVLEAYILVRDGEGEAYKRFTAAYAAAEATPFPPRPLLSGRDLQELGMKPGRQFKTILDAVDDAVLRREVTTKDEAIELVRSVAAPIQS